MEDDAISSIYPSLGVRKQDVITYRISNQRSDKYCFRPHIEHSFQTHTNPNVHARLEKDLLAVPDMAKMRGISERILM